MSGVSLAAYRFFVIEYMKNIEKQIIQFLLTFMEDLFSAKFMENIFPDHNMTVKIWKRDSFQI